MNENRVFAYDLLRCIAIVLAVTLHTVQYMHPSPMGLHILWMITWVTVPIFFMLSGGLVLPKLASWEDKRIVKHMKRMVQFLILYAVSASFCVMYNGGGRVEVWNNLKAGEHGGNGTLWYLPAIAGLYLLAPFLGILLEHLSNKQILLLLCAILCTSNLAESFNIPFLLNRFPKVFGEGYVAYFVVGYLLFYRKWVEIQKKYIIILVFGIYLITGWISGRAFAGYPAKFSLFFETVCFVIVLYNITKKFDFNIWFKKIVTAVAKYSFGIYLVHIYVLWTFLRYDWLQGLEWSKGCVLVSAVFLISLGVTWLLSKTRLTRYFVM